MDLTSISTIKHIQKKFGFRNAKSLGQNFLLDQSVIAEMVNAAGVDRDSLVIEVGPGIGVLTAGIAAKAGKVIAVEIDRDLLPVLDYTLVGYDNIQVINEDILKLDVESLVRDEGQGCKAKVMGNLPYYITTPIITGLLEGKLPIESITVMVQKEVADRILADPGSRTYGALSIACQFYAQVERVVDVPKESFYPSPKVDSTVITMRLREVPPVELEDQELFFKCVKAGFGQRRKTLLNAFNGAGYDKDEIKKILEEAGIEGTRRAETLSMEDFANIANRLYANQQQSE